MKIYLPDEIKTCIDLLNANHFECFVVGGAVRDAMLNRPVRDYDLSTNAKPNDMHKIFNQYLVLDTGIKHGTVTVIINHVHIEITTYRIETSYSDHRHPDKIAFSSSLKEDCARRDLTINALAYHPTLGLQDYFHGVDDLKHHIIRTVGDPIERFNEDALRILRAIRFAAQLDFKVDSNASNAIMSHKEDLNLIAKERITEEFIKIITSTKPGIYLYDYKELFDVFITNILSLTKKQATSIDTSINNLVVRLSILSFYLGIDSLNNLKLPNKTTSTIKLFLKYANLPLNSRYDLRYLLYVLSDTCNDYLSFKSIIDPTFNHELIQQELDKIHQRNDCTSIKELAITGKDLQDLGIHGSTIKETLEACLLKVIKEELTNTKKELLDYARKLNSL